MESRPSSANATGAGIVGIRGTLPFIDSGDMRKPEFARFTADGSSFIIEGKRAIQILK